MKQVMAIPTQHPSNNTIIGHYSRLDLNNLDAVLGNTFCLIAENVKEVGYSRADLRRLLEEWANRAGIQ